MTLLLAAAVVGSLTYLLGFALWRTQAKPAPRGRRLTLDAA